MSDCKAIFTDIYARKAWGDGSGGGSTPSTARPYCQYITKLLSGLPAGRIPAGTVLDIGCGDGVVAKGIEWGRWTYIGVDAAQGFDALTDRLPYADIVLCKEVMQHLSNAQVQLLLDRTAHYPLRIFTSMTGPGVNVDIPTGDSRPVDLSLPPFSQKVARSFKYGTDAKWLVQELTR